MNELGGVNIRKETIHQLDIGCLGRLGLVWACDHIISYYICVKKM